MQALLDAALARAERIDDPSVNTAARHLWHDTVACAWSGYAAPQVRALHAQHADLAPGRFVPPAGGAPLGAPAGAFVTALAACWDETCEGLALAHGRPGVPVVAALWALAAHRPLAWGRVLRATVLGYQVGGSMGAYLRNLPGMHVDGGWPSLGVAAAVADALGLSRERILDALETCASQLPAALYLPIAQGVASRNTYLGHAAWLGTTAALSAAAGIAGPRGAASEYARRVLRRPDDDGPPIHDEALVSLAYWKPFACVRHVQYGARAAQRLRARLGAEVGRIDAIRLRVYPEAITYCANRAPRTAIAAQFSLSHGIAAMWVRGELSPAEYAEASLIDPGIVRLESLVELVGEPARFGPGGRGAVLEVLHGGRWHAESVAAIEGDPGHPPSLAQRREKFARYCGASPDVIALGERILGADPATDTRTLMETRG